MPPYTTTRFVEFADTDMAGIVHFTAFFRYMESVEHEFVRKLGLSIYSEHDGTHISWPRVSARCDFQAPAMCEQVLDVELRIEKLSERSVTYQFTFTRDGVPLAKGEMTSVCCRIQPNEPPKSIPIPNWIREKLTKAISSQ